MPNFRIDIFKNWGQASMDGAWSNSYEIRGDGGTPGDYIDVAQTIVAAEKILHIGYVQFVQARISTWEEDSGGGYDPSSFVTIPLSGPGGRDPGNADALDYNVCYVVKRVPASGRAGRLFYRGVLTEADVSATLSGRFALTNVLLQDAGTVFQAYVTAMSELLGGSDEDPGQENVLAMISETSEAALVRVVLDLVAAGVTVNKHNHRYFDRVN